VTPRTSARDVSAGDPPTVLVVGGGPTGLTLANLLGSAGVRVVVAERHSETSQEPRAVSFDDESMRTLQACHLDEAAYGLIVRGTGTKYFGADGRILAYARGPAHPPLGHPVKNPFSQPRFERMLLDGLDRFPHVEVRMSTELVGLFERQDGPVRASLRGSDGTMEIVDARIVVGCDGGRSTVRGLLGVGMQDSSFEQPWLVVDTTGDAHDERYAMHHGDPRRPYVIVPGREGRCRYEFMILPGEDAEEMSRLAEIQRLLAPFRPVEDHDIERATIYTFHALIANHWRVRSVLLAGDAAHMMPPFAGQGLNSGIRDAVNLAWKVAAVVGGRADPALLDSYEAERRPHAEATVGFSVRLGRLMMSRSPLVARLRDRIIRAGSLVPAVDRYLSENRFKPTARFTRGAVASPERDGSGLVGTMLPQPAVLAADGSIVRLDDVLGPGFALVAVNPDTPHPWPPAAQVWSQLGTRFVEVLLDDRSPRRHDGRVTTVADADGTLTRVLDRVRGRVVLVRPDRFVAAVLPADVDQTAGDIAELFAVRTAAAAAPAADPLRDAAAPVSPVVVSEDR